MILIYTVTWLLRAFPLVVDRDLLKDTHTDGVKSTSDHVSGLVFHFSCPPNSWINHLHFYCIEQIDYIFPCACTVIDHRDVTACKEQQLHHSTSSRTLWFFTHCDVICDLLQYWHARENVMYLLIWKLCQITRADRRVQFWTIVISRAKCSSYQALLSTTFPPNCQVWYHHDSKPYPFGSPPTPLIPPRKHASNFLQLASILFHSHKKRRLGQDYRHPKSNRVDLYPVGWVSWVASSSLDFPGHLSDIYKIAIY